MPNGGRCEPGGDSTGGSVQRGRWRVNTLYAEGSTRWTPALTLWSSKRNSQRKNIGMAIPHVTARRSPWTTPVQPPAGSPAPARGYGHVRAAGHTCRSAPPRFNSQLTFHPMTSFVLPKNAALSFSCTAAMRPMSYVEHHESGRSGFVRNLSEPFCAAQSPQRALRSGWGWF